MAASSSNNAALKLIPARRRVILLKTQVVRKTMLNRDVEPSLVIRFFIAVSG